MPTIIDAEQLAEILQMNPKALQRLTRDGFIPCHRIGSNVRYCLEDVLAATKVGIHPDDKAVDNFAEALHVKMAHARSLGASGWDDPATPTCLIAEKLVDAVAKGDPIDVGNYAMMAHARGVTPDELKAALAALVHRSGGSVV